MMKDDIDRVLSGYVRVGVEEFGVRGNGDLWINEEEGEDLVEGIEKEVGGRGGGGGVGVEVCKDFREDAV
ncbi:hypothetical protein, partial [Paenibacillus xylanexedens]|uniref:hypothetical protein n=1 Tax=Paenibacillus xylanexedens TaxID=528191 RepID=UPI003F78D53A